MANAYITVDTLKGTGALNIDGTAYDGRLKALAEAVSRQVDRYANRIFYSYTEAKIFSGDGKDELFTPDYVSVSTVKEDTNQDGTFETSWGANDYLKEPHGANPTAEWGHPYTRLIVNPKSNGTQDIFQRGTQNYEITGTWGYQHITKDSGRNGTLADGTATSMTLDGTAGDLEVGQTVLIDSEQVYVTAKAGTAATVERAKNGSTGTVHTNADCLVVQYPQPVQESAFIQTARLWKRKDSGFTGVIGISEAGQMTVFTGGLDNDVKALLGPYRKIPLGVGV